MTDYKEFKDYEELTEELAADDIIPVQEDQFGVYVNKYIKPAYLFLKRNKTYTGKTVAPTANDDSSDGYVVGDRWVDETNDKEYVCLDATATAAVWMETTQGGGSGWDGDIADIDLDGGTDIGAALADADLILVDDGAGGTNRKSALSRVWTYISGKLSAANAVPIAGIDLDGGTDIGAALVDADLILVDDGAGGTNRKAAMSRVKTYAQGIKLDDLTAPDDNTDLNASTSKHGLLPKLGGGTTNYLRADGTWAAPAGGGGGASQKLFQARLTLSTGVAVPTSDVTAATTIYLTPYGGNIISLYDGASAWADFELSADISASLSGKTANTNYDVFVYDDGGLTLELVAWTNDTTRATALVLQDGVYVKSGTTTKRYCGTIRITGTTGQCQVKFGSAAAGGGEAWFGVWNAYNRVRSGYNVRDTTDSWTYTTASWRSLDNAAGNRVSVVRGLDDSMLLAHLLVPGSHSAGANAGVGLGLDSVSANSAQILANGTFSSTFLIPWHAVYRGYAGLGFHYIQALEIAGSSGTTTFYGDAGTSFISSGLTGEVEW